MLLQHIQCNINDFRIYFAPTDTSLGRNLGCTRYVHFCSITDSILSLLLAVVLKLEHFCFSYDDMTGLSGVAVAVPVLLAPHLTQLVCFQEHVLPVVLELYLASSALDLWELQIRRS